MDHISPAARTVARAWAGDRPILPVILRDLAEQAQEHLSHGADPAYLELLAAWMAMTQPTWRDLSMAMRYPSAPRPLVADMAPGPREQGRHGCPCPCRAVMSTAA
jgi:hypothetical protein